MPSRCTAAPVSRTTPYRDLAYFSSCSDLEMVAGLVENRAEAWRAMTLRYGRLIQSCISRVVSRMLSVA